MTIIVGPTESSVISAKRYNYVVEKDPTNANDSDNVNDKQKSCLMSKEIDAVS